MRYSNTHKANSREKIIKAARAAFSEDGFDGSSIEIIMAKAGMTRGGFYKHFPNKTALLLAAVEDGHIETPKKINCQVRDILARYLDDTHIEDKANACPLFSFPSDVARSNTEVKKAYENVARSITDVINLGLADRSDETASALMAMSVGCMVIMNSSHNQNFKNHLRKSVLEHIAKSLA